MRTAVRWGVAGFIFIAIAYFRMARGMGMTEWGVTFDLTALGLVVGAMGLGLMEGGRATRIGGVGLLIAALASLNVVRLLLQAPAFIDVLSLGLVAIGLCAGAWVLLRGSATPIVHMVLLGAVGGASYLVHDVVLRISAQWVPDALLLTGFTFAWIGLRQFFADPRRMPSPVGAVGDEPDANV